MTVCLKGGKINSVSISTLSPSTQYEKHEIAREGQPQVCRIPPSVLAGVECCASCARTIARPTYFATAELIR